jgi:hypothetical protein
MTGKRERQLSQLAIGINAVVAAELVVYFGSVILFPTNSANLGFAFLTILMLVSAACALANLIVLTPLVTRGKSVKQWQYRFAILMLAVSALYLAFIIFPLTAGLFAPVHGPTS